MRIPVYQTEITFTTPQLKNIQEIATFFDYTSKAILMDFWSFKFQLYIVYKKTNTYRLIDATLTPGNQIWFFDAVVVPTYSCEV